jgi:hypothetical protein
MYDADGKEILSPAALVDEPQHRAFLQKCADELRALEAPPRSPAPDLVTRRELDRRLESLCFMLGKAVRKHVDRKLKAFNPDQPRVPAGNPDGGEFAPADGGPSGDGGGGGGGRSKRPGRKL